MKSYISLSCFFTCTVHVQWLYVGDNGVSIARVRQQPTLFQQPRCFNSHGASTGMMSDQLWCLISCNVLTTIHTAGQNGGSNPVIITWLKRACFQFWSYQASIFHPHVVVCFSRLSPRRYQGVYVCTNYQSVIHLTGCRTRRRLSHRSSRNIEGRGCKIATLIPINSFPTWTWRGSMQWTYKLCIYWRSHLWDMSLHNTKVSNRRDISV